MSTLMKLQSLIMTMFIIVVTMFGFLSDVKAPTSVAKDEENIKFNVALISDTHVDARFTVSQTGLALGLTNINRHGTAVDAVIVAGDITNMNDKESVYRAFDLFRQYSDLPAQNVVLASGNHDVGHSSDAGLSHEEARQNFISAMNEYNGGDADKIYFSADIKGYHFIVLGDEAAQSTSKDGGVEYNTYLEYWATVNPAYADKNYWNAFDTSWDHPWLSDKQLNWLDSELSEYSSSTQPVFVICHWPLEDVNGKPKVWKNGGIGERYNEPLHNILESYPNVVYISGHLHKGLNSEISANIKGYSSVEIHEGVAYVNLPAYFLINRQGLAECGQGLMMEVYEDKILFRGRNFITNSWYPGFNYEVPI